MMTDEELQEMRDRHPQGVDAFCVDCAAGGSQCVARVLAHFDAALEQVHPMHDDIAYGLCGPSTSEELC